jgi:hypothetical protein
MSRCCIRRLSLAALLAVGPLFASGTLRAQGTPAAQPALPPISISGIVFANYNYQLSTTPSPLTNQANNGFNVDRIYLTFRAPVVERLNVRVTTDIFQTSEVNALNPYAIRAKYAYLQYDAPKRSNGSSMFARLGILQNVVIEQTEQFWLRFLGQSALERAGFFSSADVGLAAGVTLPNKQGEVYATIVNGPGYAARERDRFKDFAIRLSLTPLANGKHSALLQSLTLTGWGYKGANASTFVNGGVGQVDAVGEAMDRSRAGVFVGVRDPRIVLAGELAFRHDEADIGLNTPIAPRGVSEISGRMLSANVQVRPLAFTNSTGQSPYGIVARYDYVSPTTSTVNVIPAPATSNSYHNLTAGVFYDLNQRAQAALDYQEALTANNNVSVALPTQSKGYYLHFAVSF